MSKMKELIPIIINNGIKAVDGRVLHSFLEVGKDFSTWIKSRIEKYDFIENDDYQTCSPKLGSEIQGGQNRIEYIISLDMAKELSMVENNPKGREARKYFIECEKVALESTQQFKIPKTYREALVQLIEKEDQVLALTSDNNYLSKECEVRGNIIDESAVYLKSYDTLTTHNTHTYSIDQFAMVRKIRDDKDKVMGRNKMFNLMRRLGLIKQNSTMPYQQYIDNGCFVVVFDYIGYPVTNITGLGIQKFDELYSKIEPKFNIDEFIRSSYQ